MDWKYLYTSFDGRINRAKFWAGAVVLFAITAVLTFVDMFVGTYNYEYGVGILTTIFTIAAIYPAVALYAKRWHDRGKSGWWTLIILVPIIGAIWFLIEQGFLRGDQGPNTYGPDPLA